MTTMYKNELFILMYCAPMIPTGEFFQFFIFYDEWWTPDFLSGKIKIHVELERKFLKLCFNILVVNAYFNINLRVNWGFNSFNALLKSRCRDAIGNDLSCLYHPIKINNEFLHKNWQNIIVACPVWVFYLIFCPFGYILTVMSFLFSQCSLFCHTLSTTPSH